MSLMYYLLFKKQWTKRENDFTLAQRIAGVFMVLGLIYLAVGCNTFGRSTL